MGRVFKPSYTRSIPMNTPIVSHNGGPGVWLNIGPRDKLVFARLTGKPGRVRVPVDDWYIEFTDANGKAKSVRIGQDREEAERALLAAESSARLHRATTRASGVHRHALAAQTPRPLRAKAIEGIGGIHELDLTLFPFLSAVYFLSHKGEVIYVGQSVNFLSRIVKHTEEKVFDAVYYLPTAPERLEETEKRYIRELKPRDNCDEKGYIRFGWKTRRRTNP
jgi:hypothetical protein